ncbi:hypothetical protein BSF41_24670 [Flavobacterium sp. ACN2]|uniref:hypothetical protein n=1 Tax=Flavobacterium sp. ACN2 TaxID=1975676 RepID=UPI000BB3E53C|nr:hypothetical protein [Flavobacterium sp. ACN2]PBI89096.1 hypothetical protein BSF41_24670 [Flavobacterium sp. ACN2]
MNYQFTEIETHLDFGFGITGEAYYESAELLSGRKKEIQAFQLAEMPIGFLYRHSIELFLKSLIIIFHVKLQIPYDNEPFDSKRPKIFINDSWVDLYNYHRIDELYNYWTYLLNTHQSQLKKLSPNDDWSESQKISRLIPLIAGYDNDSTYFRYPITKNTSADGKKHTMQKLNIKNLEQKLHSTEHRKSKMFMVLKDNENEIVEAFERNENVLDNVTSALKKVSNYFLCMHVMSRVTLCDKN